VFCAVTKLNSVDVRSLCSCTVCCRMSLWSVVCVHNDIRPHTLQEHNERTSTKFNLVTAQSTAHEPPEDGRKYGPKHVGASFLKFLSVLSINVN
jgi:hypothetical protein